MYIAEYSVGRKYTVHVCSVSVSMYHLLYPIINRENVKLWPFRKIKFSVLHLSFISQAPKQYPYNNLYLERGGDPENQPEEVKNYEI